MPQDSTTSREQAAGYQPTRGKDGDLTDMQAEMWILLPIAQTLTAFLILLPFNSGDLDLGVEWRTVYIITFGCALLSMVLFTAPAAHHRIHRPVLDRENFKTLATRYMVAGLAPLSIATFFATQLVFTLVIPIGWLSWMASGLVAVMLLVMWWLIPLRRKRTTTKT